LKVKGAENISVISAINQPASLSKFSDKINHITGNFSLLDIKLPAQDISDVGDRIFAITVLPDQTANKVELVHHAGKEQDNGTTIINIFTGFQSLEDVLLPTLFNTPDNFRIT